MKEKSTIYMAISLILLLIILILFMHKSLSMVFITNDLPEDANQVYYDIYPNVHKLVPIDNIVEVTNQDALNSSKSPNMMYFKISNGIKTTFFRAMNHE